VVVLVPWVRGKEDISLKGGMNVMKSPFRHCMVRMLCSLGFKRVGKGYVKQKIIHMPLSKYEIDVHFALHSCRLEILYL
jgi:hypothetical protein